MKNFFKIGILYSIGQVIIKGIAFLLIPLYSRYLGPETYGQLALVDIVYSFFSIFIIFSIYSGYVRYYKEDQDNNGFATIFNFALISIIIQGILILAFGRSFSIFLFKIENSYTILKLIFIRISLEQIIVLFEMTYSMNYKIKKIITFRLVITLISLLIILYLVIVKKEMITGIYKGYILGNLVVLFYLLYDNKDKIKIIFKYNFFKKCFGFSLGILLGGVSYLILAMIDRFFLKEYQNFSQVGVYSMGYKFASLIEILFLASFKKIFTPFKFKEYKKKNFQHKIDKFYNYYNIIGIIIFLLTSVNIKLILYLFTTREFLDAYLITPIIIFSYLLYGQVEFYTIGIYLRNKTYLDSLVITLGGITNIILNIFWIKRYGMYGAAFSTILSYITMSIIYVYISNKIFFLKFKFIKMFKIFMSGISIYLIYFFISFQNLNILLETFLGNILVILYVFFVYYYFISKEDNLEIKKFILSKIKRR